MKFRMGILCVAVIWIAAMGRAQQPIQYSEGAETVFHQALDLYTKGAYREAADAFGALTRQYPASQRVTAAYVMRGKALLYANDNLECARVLKAFLAKFPLSSYVPDADLTLGTVYQRVGRDKEALAMFTDALRHLPAGAPKKLEDAVYSTLDSTIDATVTTATLRGMIESAMRADERAFLWVKVGEKENAASNFAAARVVADTLSKYYAGTRFSARGASLRTRLAEKVNVKIGVLLPLMKNAQPSALREPGNEVYDGILYAHEQYVRDEAQRVRIALETRDTDREPATTIRYARELADDRNVIGVIGPVFSATTSAALAVTNGRGLPLITPTANSNGLAVAGPFGFQANPDYETRGKAMARYAVVNRQWSTLAVLAPSDAYGKLLADGFVREATRLGANVVATEWYQKGAADLKAQLGAIRRAGVKVAAEPQIAFGGKLPQKTLMKFVDLGVPPARLDSLMARGVPVSAVSVLGPDAKRIADSLGINLVYDESHGDSMQYPISAIQACYLPISSPDEIGVMVSQLTYFNLQTQILGSGEWNNFMELDANKRYSTGVIFESDTYIDSTSTAFGEFQKGFMARFRRKPTRNTLYGYDCARMIFSLVAAGATTRETLARALAGVTREEGLHSRIGFSAGRVNSWLHILQYDKDRITKIAEVHTEP